jgi:hypothetical protein
MDCKTLSNDADTDVLLSLGEGVCWLFGFGRRSVGNRYQHLEAAYAETLEVQTDLRLLRIHGVDVPASLNRQAERLGGLIYGLLRAEARA